MTGLAFLAALKKFGSFLAAHWLEALIVLVIAVQWGMLSSRKAEIARLAVEAMLLQEQNKHLTESKLELSNQLGVQNSAVLGLSALGESRAAEAAAAVAAVRTEAVRLERSAQRLLQMPAPAGDPCRASSELVGQYVTERQRRPTP